MKFRFSKTPYLGQIEFDPILETECQDEEGEERGCLEDQELHGEPIQLDVNLMESQSSWHDFIPIPSFHCHGLSLKHHWDVETDGGGEDGQDIEPGGPGPAAVVRRLAAAEGALQGYISER